MVAKVNGSVRLECDGTVLGSVRCAAHFLPRPKMVDLTVDKQQRAELDFWLRLRASKQGWRSDHRAGEDWIDLCPTHKGVR